MPGPPTRSRDKVARQVDPLSSGNRVRPRSRGPGVGGRGGALDRAGKSCWANSGPDSRETRGPYLRALPPYAELPPPRASLSNSQRALPARADPPRGWGPHRARPQQLRPTRRPGGSQESPRGAGCQLRGARCAPGGRRQGRLRVPQCPRGRGPRYSCLLLVLAY